MVSVPIRRRFEFALAAVVALSLAACGSDGDGADPPPVATAGQGDGSTTSGQASEGSGDDDFDDGLGEEFECTITAEQVSEVFGVPVERSEGTCSFSPGAAAGQPPSAAFLGQLSELCEGDFLEQSGYTERVEGLGVDAFLKPGETATAEVWVCAPAAFYVVVGVGPDLGRAGAVAAAETLALIALEG